MKPKRARRIVREAFSMADDVLARLVARGVPPVCMPARNEVVALVLPLAYRLDRARRFERKTARTHAVASGLRTHEATASAARLDGIVTALADVKLPPAGVRLAHMVPFRPGDWRVSLTPAASCPAPSEREVA